MDDQLNYAPCGYLVMQKDGRIMEANQTMLDMLELAGHELADQHIHSILTVPSKMYYQTYFTPLISMYQRVNEMYLTLRSRKEHIPVLVNAIEREGRIEFVFMQMKLRDEYENELIWEKRHTEWILQETNEAYWKLQQLMSELESKKQELVTLNAELQEMALSDPLTGLKNRRFFQERMAAFLQQAETEEVPFSILLIDVDHFKKVNDTFGHPIGDLVLQELAVKLENEIREEDVVARMGGEEFVIILSQTSAKKVRMIAERVRKNIAYSVWAHTAVTVSIGAATYEKDDTSITLLSRADGALYQSKKEGRNRVSFQ
ncbi:GGDEF domain-containing protein [Domibacillus antri]|uniref:GGDEF domain-containing protein n=1 Tax=Domibacillus antri TaxID=1714264 RepID=A0A1Q8Q9E4_9BACI|nr:sensor domain-containing diguanylate cyclase [Domibacillus antri]OLN23912.1 GGDEF domain-containing protein [Domibacillus antri]